MSRMKLATSAAACVACMILILGGGTLRWGYHGHEISGRAAATDLPSAMPPFFRDATEHMAYLNPEPDRWRGDGFQELNEAMRYDHYIDMEVIPDSVLAARDRFLYLMGLQQAGIEHPAKDAGLLPFRIVELYQSLVVEFRLWRREQDPAKKRMIEQRILNDAGILGHYVADGANPHHTSVHHNGWNNDFPNPRNFNAADGFHSRFESRFVEAHVRTEDILPHVNAQPRLISTADMRGEVMAYLKRSHARLERLYELDQAESFGAETKGAAHREFAIERLAAGVNMLRDIWWSAWVNSETAPPGSRER